MKIKYLILSIFIFSKISGQTKFKVEMAETNTWRNIYSLVDKKNKIIKVLDSSKYYISFTLDKYLYFAVFGKKDGGSGWSAIDSEENLLFQVYNTSYGEPNPDYLIEKKIRIIDNFNKIGFANEKGKIIIKPQFEFVTSFHNGKAIIGVKCKKIAYDEHAKENDCHHYYTVCENFGYINKKGEVLKLGNYTFEEIKKEIDWKADEIE